MASPDSQEPNFEQAVEHLPQIGAKSPEDNLSHTDALRFMEMLRTTQPALFDAIDQQTEATAVEIADELNYVEGTDRYVLTDAELRAMLFRVAQDASAKVLSMTGLSLTHKQQEISELENIFLLSEPGSKPETDVA